MSWVSSIYPHPKLKDKKNHKTDFIVSPLCSEKAFAFVNSEREKKEEDSQKGQTQHLLKASEDREISAWCAISKVNSQENKSKLFRILAGFEDS